jgi:hypothetical protein
MTRRLTRYFQETRQRADRRDIQWEWIERAIAEPVRELKQADGRLRRWVLIPEAGNRYLRVILLPDS